MPTERKPAFPYFAGIAVYPFCSKNKPSASVTAMDYISGDPEKNLPKLLSLIEGLWWDKRQAEVFRKILDSPDNVWYRYLMGLWRDIDNDILKATFRNFGLNATLFGYAEQEKNREKYGCNIPWAILMDPTSACNLHCTGCWAAEYGNKLNLSYAEMDSIVNQANELGCYFFLFTGGEPQVRKKDIIQLCQAHPDCQFTAFTNATLIDEAFAGDMLRVKNFIPAISVEGFEASTDFRRGAGTFRRIEQAMAILREKRLPFGLSCCYTSQNTQVIGSEEYFDQMIRWGAKFCWLFTYMPVGKDAVPELMVSAEQRKFMYQQVRKFRETKPIFTMDFWNDGEYAGGCIAGGRRYLHINANGDMDPCAFIHYSDSSIREKTLLEGLRSPLFMAYHDNQPFSDNLLRPCPLLDNQGALAKMVKASGAHFTDLQNPEDVEELTDKCIPAADRPDLPGPPPTGWTANCNEKEDKKMDAVMTCLRRTLLSSPKQRGVSYPIRYSTLFWLFMLGSVAGFVLEGLWCVLCKGHWEHHSATVWGPFCLIYGIGAVAVYLLSVVLKSKNLLVQFGVFTVYGAAVEYFGSLFQELCFGSVSWDYSEHMLNLGGRVSLKMAFMWGALGIVFMRFAFPWISRLLEKMKGTGWRIACVAMTVFMAVNLLVTSAAITRWKTRTAGEPANNPVVQWLDDTYGDETMARLFPNMQFTE